MISVCLHHQIFDSPGYILLYTNKTHIQTYMYSNCMVYGKWKSVSAIQNHRLRPRLQPFSDAPLKQEIHFVLFNALRMHSHLNCLLTFNNILGSYLPRWIRRYIPPNSRTCPLQMRRRRFCPRWRQQNLWIPVVMPWQHLVTSHWQWLQRSGRSILYQSAWLWYSIYTQSGMYTQMSF